MQKISEHISGISIVFLKAFFNSKYLHNMKALFSVLFVTLIAFSSCNFKSSDYKALQEQNDSLMRAKQLMQEEIDEYFSAMNQ